MFAGLRRLIWEASYRTRPFKGKERLVALLSRPRNPDHSTITRQGVNWYLQGHDLNEFAIAVRPNHSRSLSGNLIAEIQRNNVRVFWDIGANIGAITLPLLKTFGAMHATLFEPSAEVAGRLIRNLSINPELAQRATVMNVALADSNGVGNFYVSNETFNSGVAGLGHSHNRFQFAVRVQTYTGDSLVSSGMCPIPELLKIDVEGFELEVLKGLEKTLLERHPTIFFEHAIYRLNERNQPKDAVTQFLESLGYTLYRSSDNKKVTAADLERDDDLIARAS
jgi:FkbM family methyltransferase